MELNLSAGAILLRREEIFYSKGKILKVGRTVARTISPFWPAATALLGGLLITAADTNVPGGCSLGFPRTQKASRIVGIDISPGVTSAGPSLTTAKRLGLSQTLPTHWAIAPSPFT